MVELELVLLALVVVFVVGVVAILGVTAVGAWLTARLATNFSTLVKPAVLGPTDIQDVELRVAGMRALDHVDTGVVTDVVPERRRGARGLSRFTLNDGVRFDLALATPDDRTATLWVPVPERLTGHSRFERIASACDVSPEQISDAVGSELPLVRESDGSWRIGEHRSESGSGPAAFTRATESDRV
ncbi:hypothetical protein C440_11113 [Haloferax mucosum ATCC BAA-1512]|uniref:Uncharacterized protein n=1 Tax=Haloferax mucosum ATCC BAA-1512 TaxID=662479 RepID=M0IBM9_9EURY|nr:hypothetical protein [Haloferax mucosum]ELZ94166.1 hypothetical protein C440_11113 [Haloferax mucosum ATCC BAA-1512]